MTKPLKFILLFFFLGFIISCNSKKQIHYAKPGKYGTVFPGSQSGLAITSKYIRYAIEIKNQKLLQIKYKKDFKAMVLYLLYLREDSSFVLGTCNNQVRMAGRYIIKPDSVILYNIYDFSVEQKQPDKRLYFERKTKSIFFTTSNILEPPTLNPKHYIYKERVAVLRPNFRSHTGYLRNEDWPLDSLLKNNKYWEKTNQFQWIDSFSKVR